MNVKQSTLSIIAILFATTAISKESITTTPTLGDCASQEDILDLSKASVNRAITNGANSTLVFQTRPDAKSTKVVEEYRKSRIQEDLEAIAKATSGQKVLFVDSPKPKCFTVTQHFKRAALNIEVSDGTSTISEKRVLVGPAEHLYLSADMPVTDIKQLTYDSATSSVVEKEEPSTVYLGVNWQLGDIYTDFNKERPFDKLSIKAMLKASKRPSESMGIGLGYNLGVVEVFVAHLWTKDDTAVSGPSLGTTDSTAFGISFNITKGISWLKEE